MTPTKEHLDFFEKEFLIQVDNLNLRDWIIYFEHKKLEDCHAETTAEFPVATISFNLETEKKYLTPTQLRATAKHEAVHVLLAKLTALGKQRHNTTEELLDEEEESIACILEKVI